MNGTRLAELREAAGISQAELARRSGLHQSFISRLEAGRVENITRNTYLKLAGALGMALTSIMVALETEPVAA